MLRSNRFRFMAMALWALVVGSGVFVMAKYEATPGSRAPAGNNWVAPAGITLARDKWNLVMFLHPKCPCSDASVDELSRVMEHCGSRLKALVVMFQSSSESDEWNHTATWYAANRISGVAVNSDVDAVLARKFGAQTSGQVFLYDPRGHLAFSGGITGSRGHVGDNDGLDVITGLILNTIPPGPEPAHAPVFGCAIYSDVSDEIKSPWNQARK